MPADATLDGSGRQDDAGVRDLTLKLLDRLGYRTVEASDAHEALERLDEAPEIALVFTDVVLTCSISRSPGQTSLGRWRLRSGGSQRC